MSESTRSGPTEDEVDGSEVDASEADVSEAEAGDDGGGRGTRDVLEYAEWAGLGLCVLLVIVAGLRVYTGIGAFISLWVASKYEPLVSAGFNLAVLLVAAYGATILSRRLTAST